MACAEFFSLTGLSTTKNTLSELTDAVFNNGIDCVNSNMASCANSCSDLTKTSSACYSCLSQVNSCPGSICIGVNGVNCSSNPTDPCCSNSNSCCPYARSAVECGTCVAHHAGSNSQSVADFEACLKPTGLSKSKLIIIIVVSVVVLIIILAIIIVVVKVRKQAASRQKLVDNLTNRGVDKRIVHQIGDLNYSKIDSSIFHQADVDIALKQASKRVQNVPKPVNVAASQLTNEEDGLFSL